MLCLKSPIQQPGKEKYTKIVLCPEGNNFAITEIFI